MLDLKFGTGNRTKTALIANILRNPQPAVDYQGEELKKIYLMRTKKQLGNRSKEQLLREVRLVLPGFKKIKRESMDGIPWLRFVSDSIDFRTANKNMFHTDFGFRFYNLRTDLIAGNLSPTDQQRIKEEWFFVKSMPQFPYYINNNEFIEIEHMVNNMWGETPRFKANAIIFFRFLLFCVNTKSYDVLTNSSFFVFQAKDGSITQIVINFSYVVNHFH